MANLYGDILSDVAAQIAGSVGIAGSANIGDDCAMFEAIHGSAPRRAGQNLANPSGLLMGAVMMLVHIGQSEVAERVHNAWLRTLEDGIHTYDIYDENVSVEKVGTREFADAVIARVGTRPQKLKPVVYKTGAKMKLGLREPRQHPQKALVGVDVFLDWQDGNADELAAILRPLAGDALELIMISSRGTKVWPRGFSDTFVGDHWCCRYAPDGGGTIKHWQIVALLNRFDRAHLDFIKTENLYDFDGTPGYSLAQGQCRAARVSVP